MNKIVKIGCGGLITLFALATIFGIIANKHDGPRQSFQFLNTSAAQKSVTFEMIDPQDTSSNVRYLDEILEPDASVIKTLPEGKYIVQVWDEKDLLYKEFNFEFKLPNPDESNHHLYRFDLAMDKNYYVLNLNALYEGNAFAEHMSNALGTNNSQIEISEQYPGDKPFLIPESITGRTFIDLNYDIPSSVKYGEVVYGLFYTPNNLNQEEASTLLYEKVMAKN